jgi:DNA repair exonuclease SbcCD ATPase subunit
MLKDEKCKVYDRAAANGSTFYKNIQGFINPESIGDHIELIHRLEGIVESNLPKITSISDQIKLFYNKVHVLDDKIRTLKAIIDSKEKELDLVVKHLENDKLKNLSKDDLKSIDYVQLKRNRDTFKTDLKDYIAGINNLKGKIEELDRSLEKKKTDHAKAVEQTEDDVENRRYLLAKKIYQNAEKLHDNFIGKFIYDIEEQANKYFNSMTANNKALYGRIRIDHKANEVYPVDVKGNRIQNINQANIVSIQIAFVAAVISVSSRFWNREFPFITDGPVTTLGGNNKLSALQTMGEIFGQAIIIMKDDALLSSDESKRNDLIRRFIQSNDKIGQAYELTMNKNEGNETFKYTIIKPLK